MGRKRMEWVLVGGNEQPAEWRPGLRSCSDHDSLVIDPVWAHCADAEVDSVNEVYIETREFAGQRDGVVTCAVKERGILGGGVH